MFCGIFRASNHKEAFVSVPGFLRDVHIPSMVFRNRFVWKPKMRFLYELACIVFRRLHFVKKSKLFFPLDCCHWGFFLFFSFLFSEHFPVIMLWSNSSRVMNGRISNQPLRHKSRWIFWFNLLSVLLCEILMFLFFCFVLFCFVLLFFNREERWTWNRSPGRRKRTRFHKFLFLFLFYFLGIEMWVWSGIYVCQSLLFSELSEVSMFVDSAFNQGVGIDVIGGYH
jgi:hypothetical protein